jgi:alpha-L-fucosidase
VIVVLTATILLAAPAASAHLQRRVAAAPYQPTRQSLDQHPLPQWWTDAKFGIFIHWGVYSVPAYAPPRNTTFYAEWYWAWQQVPGTPQWLHHVLTYGPATVYDDFIPQFRAERFDPKQWIDLFKQAGAKYFVLTSKHHDGFALWPTQTTHRDSVDTGPHRDLVGELVDAARGSGLHTGLYYSLPEWFNPAARPLTATLENLNPLDVGSLVVNVINTVAFGPKPARNAYTQVPVPYTGYTPINDYATGQVIPQIEDLTHRYHPSILWCDIGGDAAYFRSNRWIADFYNAAATTNPDGVVIDDRCGDSTTHSDYHTVEYGRGTATPPFEATRGMGSSFGYNAQEGPGDYLTDASMVDTLVTTVANGGNLLLDIGPKADGTIPQIMVDRLKSIGAWLAINGAAIYGSHRWTQPGEGDLRFTVGHDGDFYITALAWPGQTLTVNAPVPVIRAASRITLLGSNGQPLPFHKDGSKLIITTPAGGNQRAATSSQNGFVFRISSR